MTGPEIMAVVGFGLAIFGTIFGIWKYLDAKLGAVRAEAATAASTASAQASLARDELGAFKLRVAETYATKAGMEAQTAQIMRAIEGVGNRIDGLNERLDRIYESRPRTSRRAAGD